MAKRKVIRKSNRLFTYNPHYYSWGGDFNSALGINPFDLKGTFSGGNVAGMLKGGLASGIGSAVGNIAGGAISGGLESGAGSAISNIGGTIGGAVGAVNPVLGGIISAGSGIIGGLTNRMFGSKLNKENIANIEGTNNAMNTIMVDNSSNDAIENQWLNQDFGKNFTKSDIGKDGWFSRKAKKKYKQLKAQQNIARDRALASYDNAVNAADTQTDLTALANYAAFGGPLGIWEGYGNGAIGYELAKEDLDIKALNAANKGRLTSLPNSFESSELNTFAEGGKIHIKSSKRGTFTAAAKRHGKSVQGFASQVLANKEDYSPDMVKKANFARNAAKWHSFGGNLNTNGADFSNGQIIVGNGGTHEENPYEGVPMGTDTAGVPNLVEQGEVIFGNYVFSNRLFADGGLLESFNLPKSYDGYSFAAIAEKLGNESEERPNDPISKRGLLSSMSRLQQAQETVRQHSQVSQESTQYKGGGGLTIDDVNNSPIATVVKLLDPTGVSSWYDVYSAGKDMYKNPSWSNAGSLALESFGAIPLIGKAGKAIKGAMKLGTKLYAKKAAEKYGLDLTDDITRSLIDQAVIRTPGFSKDTYDTVKYRRQKGNKKGNKKAHGGRMGTLFDGFGPYPNHLLTINDSSVPEGTMFDPISNRYVFTGYQDSDANPLNFGSGITPSGEWVEEPKYMARAAAKRAGHYVGDSLDAYMKDPVENPNYYKGNNNKSAAYLRYAPVIGAAIGLGQNLFSKPDYTSADAILEAAKQAGNYTPIGYTPIGNYLQYRPFDKSFYINKLNAQAGATRRAIMNTTNPSRNAALLAADYNAQGKLGDLARQAEEYNLAQRQAVETFNRGTNQANAEMGLKAAMANQEAELKARSSKLSGIAQAMAVRDAVDARRGASMSANLTNFFNSLGDIGREEYSRNMIMSNPALYYSIDSKGNVTYKNGYESLSEAEKKEVRDAANKAKKKKKAKGGYLTIKKK